MVPTFSPLCLIFFVAFVCWSIIQTETLVVCTVGRESGAFKWLKGRPVGRDGHGALKAERKRAVDMDATRRVTVDGLV